MAHWLLQCDPVNYRLLAAAAVHAETDWSARQSADRIAVGDDVVFWISGDEAGAYALGTVTSSAETTTSDPRYLEYWSEKEEASTPNPRIRARYDRLLFGHPVLRTDALRDAVLKDMTVVKRGTGTVFALSSAQYLRLTELAQRPATWARSETVLVLAIYVANRTFDLATQRASVTSLSRLLDRSETTIEMALRNFQYLDTGTGLENASALARRIWAEYAQSPKELAVTAAELRACLLDGGGLAKVDDELRLVRSLAELNLSISRFRREATAASARARNLFLTSTHWVYDHRAQSFGPGKLVAYANMSLERYDELATNVNGSTDSQGWLHLPANPRLQRPAKRKRDGSHTTITLALELTGTEPGATVEEIDAALASLGLSGDHTANRLLKFMSSDRGWGFLKDPETGRITLLREPQHAETGVAVASLLDGSRTRRHLESTIGRDFEADGTASVRLAEWGRSNAGLSDESNVDTTKWKFLSINQEEASKPVSTTSNGIYEFLERQGLSFPRELVATYLLALKTKPFVILSGISGTGKTKLAQAVAEWAGVEEITVTEHAPDPAALLTAQSWTYELHPYNFRHRKIVIARDAEALFELPSEGSTPVTIHFEGQSYEGSIGAIRPDSRLMYELRLGTFLEAFKVSFKPSDFVRISVQNDVHKQEVFFTRVAPQVRTRTESIRRYEFVTVRPDWLDSKEILGFYNLLSEEYVPRSFLQILLRAHRDPDKPYFTILDEMNLARVEHYFADFLSASESRKRSVVGEGIDQEPVHLHDLRQCIPLDPPDGWERPSRCGSCAGSDAAIAKCSLMLDGVQLVPPRLRIPLNVYVTGTVNIDETTHQFSPKVLDRANVIEFNTVNLTGSATPSHTSNELVLRDGNIDLGPCAPATLSDFTSASPLVRSTLQRLNELLEPFNLHFGYRSANEIAMFVKNAITYVGPDAEPSALDLQLLQKVLPKLHGSKARILEPLWKLLLFAIFDEARTVSFNEVEFRRIDAALISGSAVSTDASRPAKEPLMPRTAKKLARMLRVLRDQGFVSFIE